MKVYLNQTGSSLNRSFQKLDGLVDLTSSNSDRVRARAHIARAGQPILER